MFQINIFNRKPIYEQLIDQTERLILTGILTEEEQLPSVRSLSVELSVNPNTIQKAYAMLEQEGFIYPVRGRGNFVSGDETLKKKKQERVYCSLQELVRQGKTLEIPQETFISWVREYYECGSQGDGHIYCEKEEEGAK